MFVRKSMRQAALAMVIAAALITACSGGAAAEPTVDVSAINTAAVETAMAQLSAQFTETAMVAPTVTTLPTNTAISLPTFALPGAATGSPVAASSALPTVSFNSTPVTPGTPLPGFTALPTAGAGSTGPTASLGDSCNNSEFVSDVTIPDGSVLEPGKNFEKIWQVKNTGTCTWDEGYALVYIGGSSPNLDPYNFEFKQSSDFVAGGSTVNLALTLTTPCNPGEYQGSWRMRNDQGAYFGTFLTVIVKVTDDC
jgi:Ig-like domain-containing protein